MVLVVFDEFHERSIHADVAMALAREAQQTLRPDLRIMVMSATLDMPQLTRLLDAPVAQSLGRQYPVEVIYAGEADEQLLPEMTARVVQQALHEKTGDVLVFLPGEGDIRKLEELLRRKLRDVAIAPAVREAAARQAVRGPDARPQRQAQSGAGHQHCRNQPHHRGRIGGGRYGLRQNARFDPRSGLSASRRFGSPKTRPISARAVPVD